MKARYIQILLTVAVLCMLGCKGTAEEQEGKTPVAEKATEAAKEGEKKVDIENERENF